jgi:membrane-associated phospholipid phosphatase
MLTAAVAVAFSFKHIDLPVLAAIAPHSHSLTWLGERLGSAVLLGLEATIFLVLAFTRVVRGNLSDLGKATAAACVSSICAYAVNASVLKVMFGVLPTGYVLTGWPHVAHWFQGSPDSSFPSGHMVLAGAFAGVLMRHYPKTVLPLAGLLAGAGCLLVAGSWHFVSDVLAGTAAGVVAGLLAAEVWLVHERARA